MKYFAGLDVSLEETAICVVDESGRIVKEMRAASEPEALIKALRKVGLAAGAHRPGSVLADGLASRRIARRRPAGDLHRDAPGQCGDEDDAEQDRSQRCPRACADHAHRLVSAGACQEPAMPVMALAAGRPPHGAERDAYDRERGARHPARGRRQARHAVAHRLCRSRARAGRRTEVMAMVEPLLAILRVMLKEFTRLTKQVLDIVRKEEVCRRLMSVPGVGPITALTFRATIDRPERFGSSRAVGAHLGLTPARYQSGETDIQGKVSRCGDELARTALYEAAHSLLVRVEEMVEPARLGHEHRQDAAAWRGPAWRSPASWPSSCTACGPTRPSSASERSLPHRQRDLRQRSKQHGQSFRPKGRCPDRSRGDDGRGDLVESPEPAEPRSARS